MKFITPFITLIAAATVAFANPIGSEISEEEYCSNNIDCFYKPEDVNLSNLDSICASFNSEKCQNIYFSPEYRKLYLACGMDYRILLFKYIRFEFLCAKDENGNICPVTKLMIENKDMKLDDERFIQATNDTCKSKSCHNALKKMLVSKLEGVIKYGKIGEVMKTLKSDECTAQHQNAATTQDGNCKP